MAGEQFLPEIPSHRDAETGATPGASDPTGRFHLHLVAFTSGAVVMALELLGTRMLAPVCGMSIHVWAAMITVTLASVAVGYHHGGKAADEANDARPLGHLLMAAAVGIAVTSGCSRFVLLLLAPIDLRLAALLGSLLLFGFPLACLGAVMPICVKLATHEIARVGKSVGSLYVASTVGSCVGTLVTGFVLIPHCGIVVSLTATVLWLFGFGLAGSVSTSLTRPGVAAFVVLVSVGTITRCHTREKSEAVRLTAGPFSMWSGVQALETYYRDYREPHVPPPRTSSPVAIPGRQGRKILGTDSLMGRLELWTTGDQELLLADGMLQTAMQTDTHEITGRHHLFPERYWLELLPYMRPLAHKALLIGLGGGLLPRVLESYGISTHAVEVDPKVVKIARSQFGYRGPVTVADGRRFLEETRDKFDLIILDAFTGDSPPSHLLTREALTSAARHLTPDGVLAINLIEIPRTSEVLNALGRTLGQVFFNRVAYATDSPERVQMLTVFASGGPLSPQQVTRGPIIKPTAKELERARAFVIHAACADYGRGKGPLLRDDRNPFDVLYAPVALEWRRATADLLGY